MQRQTLFPPLIVRTAPSPTSTPRLPLLTGRATEVPHPTGGSNAPRFVNEGWTIALTVLTSVRLLLLLTLWIYLTKRTLAVRVPLRRVWLTQLLLASLALSHVVLYAFVVQPTPISCAIIRLGVGLSYALPFVVLTLKLIIVTATYKGKEGTHFTPYGVILPKCLTLDLLQVIPFPVSAKSCCWHP